MIWTPKDLMQGGFDGLEPPVANPRRVAFNIQGS